MPHHLEIGVIKAVDNVPAQLQELLAFQKDAMEEAEGKEQLLVFGGLRAAGELGLCDELVETFHVGLQSLLQKEKETYSQSKGELSRGGHYIISRLLPSFK